MMTNKNTIVVNYTTLESEVRKTGKVKHFGEGQEAGMGSVLLSSGQGILFWLFSKLPSPIAPHPLRLKQKFLIRMLQHLKGQKKGLKEQPSQPLNHEAITTALCPKSPERLTFWEGGTTKEETKLHPSSHKPVGGSFQAGVGPTWEGKDLMICAFPSSPSLPLSWNLSKPTSHTHSLPTASPWPKYSLTLPWDVEHWENVLKKPHSESELESQEGMALNTACTVKLEEGRFFLRPATASFPRL